MTTYYVTADHKISTSVFNPPDGWILAEFPVDEPPFNPLKLFNGCVEQLEKNQAQAKAQAEAFLSQLIASGHQPENIRDTPEYKQA